MKKKAKTKKVKKKKNPPVKKKAAKKKKLSKKKTLKPKKKGSSKPAAPAIAGERVGEITHFFPHVNAAVVKIAKGSIQVGDSLYIKGHTTDLKMTVQSLQIDHSPIQKAVKGDEAGLGVSKRVRPGDQVYRLDR